MGSEPKPERFLADMSTAELEDLLERSIKAEEVLLSGYPYLRDRNHAGSPGVLHPDFNAFLYLRDFVWSKEERELHEIREKTKEIRLLLIRKERNPEGAVSVQGKRDPELLKRGEIVRQSLRDNPRMATKDICTRLDTSDTPTRIPESWRTKFNVKSWREAYHKPQLRGSVQSLISKEKRNLKHLPDLPSKS